MPSSGGHETLSKMQNMDKTINYSILVIEAVNLSWSIVGTILNIALHDPSSNFGAIIDVIKK